MPSPASPLGVFDAADVLGRTPLPHLRKLSRLLAPRAAAIERSFQTHLRERRFDAKQIKALTAITAGTAACLIAEGKPPAAFFEQVEYSGRRLAKLNVGHAAILEALRAYDSLAADVLKPLLGADADSVNWARQQLQLCVFLSLNKAFAQVRDAEAQAFYDLFRAELEAYTLDDLLTQFLSNLTRICLAQYGRLILLDADGILQSKAEAHALARSAISPGVVGTFHPIAITRGLVRQLAKTRYIRGGDAFERIILDRRLPGVCRSYWSIPVFHQDRLAGVIQLAFLTERPWLPRELQLVDSAVEQCLQAAEKARLVQDLAAREEQVRQLGEHMWQVEEEERRRISRELHDEAGQSMLFIRLQLEMLVNGLPAADRALKTRLTEVQHVTQNTILELRRIISALSPAVLEQLGLGPALRQLSKRFQMVYPAKIRLSLPQKLGRLPKQAEIITYRLVQECCNNIAKHSAAKTVNIHLSSSDSTLELRVEDDGVGFDVELALRKENSFGLAGMMERVVLLGGQFSIESTPRKGTRILISLPLTAMTQRRQER